MSDPVRVAALVHRADDLSTVRLGVQLGETTAIALAPPGDVSEEVMRASRAVGAARTVRVWDDAIVSTDYLGIAFTLAATVRTLMGDLTQGQAVILCGDGGLGAVGPALAERLGVPHLGHVFAVGRGEGRVIVRRGAGAEMRAYAGTPPVVLCVTPDGKPTPADGGTGTTEVWTLEQAGIAAAEVAYRKRFRARPEPGPTAKPRVFDDARALAARLLADGLVGGPSK